MTGAGDVVRRLQKAYPEAPIPNIIWRCVTNRRGQDFWPLRLEALQNPGWQRSQVKENFLRVG
jgi:hypothetical protein